MRRFLRVLCLALLAALWTEINAHTVCQLVVNPFARKEAIRHTLTEDYAVFTLPLQIGWSSGFQHSMLKDPLKLD